MASSDPPLCHPPVLLSCRPTPGQLNAVAESAVLPSPHRVGVSPQYCLTISNSLCQVGLFLATLYCMGFFLPSSSSQAALLPSGTKPHYLKAPFPVIFQKELSVILSCPSVNDVCSPFPTSYCCTIAKVSLTIVLCVPQYHRDISSLAKAGPSLHCQKPPPFFPLFAFTSQQLYVSAACTHVCGTGSRGGFHQQSTRE